MIANQKRIFNVTVAILAVLLAGFAMQGRLQWVLLKDYPNATDSFYYLQEFKSRIFNNESYYVSYSLFFWFWSGIGKILSLDPVQTHNAVFYSSLLTFCLAILVYLKESLSKWFPYALIAMYLMSDLLFYRQYAFLKQGFAISIFFLGAALFQTSKQKITIRLFALGLICFAALMHIFVAAVAMVFLALQLFTSEKYKPLIGLSITGILFYFCYTLNMNPKFLFELGGFFRAGWWGTCNSISCSEFEWQEFYIYSFTFLVLLVHYLLAPKSFKNLFPYTLIILILLLNLNLWAEQGDMRNRLAVASVWLMYMLISSSLSEKTWLPSTVLAGAFPVLTCCFMLSAKKPYQAAKLPFRLLEEKKAVITAWLPPGSFILADHGLEFAVSYFFDRPAASKLPVNIKFENTFQLKQQSSGKDSAENCSELHDGMTTAQTRCIRINDSWALVKLSGQI